MTTEIGGWFAGRIPDGWFTDAPEVHVDREEIVVIGTLEAPATKGGPEAKEAARLARATRFREETRDARVRVAEEAEHRFGRKVSWGVEVDGERYLFTHAAVPVMTRLRFGERAVLDTLIDAGVARSRSEALAWCVRLVNQHQSDWITELREAIANVERVRAGGPDPSATTEGSDEGAPDEGAPDEG